MQRSKNTSRPTEDATEFPSAFSDNEPARKRGRPPLMPPAEYDTFAKVAPGLSKRSLQNRYHAAHAWGVLAPDDFDYDFLLANGGRRVLLAALGRLGDPRFIRHVGRIICERAPSCREGLRIIRDFRCEMEAAR